MFAIGSFDGEDPTLPELRDDQAVSPRPLSTVTCVRRIAVILACATVALTSTWATASTAAAHPLPQRSLVPVGRPGTVTIGIPSEATVAMTGVDIHIPATYRVIRLEPPPGWTGAISGGQMHFAHGNVAPGSFALFSFRGQASERGRLKFDLVIHNAKGHAQLWAGVQGKDPYPAPVVFAGVPARATTGSGPNVLRLAGWGLLAIGVAAALWRVARGRRTSRIEVEPADQVGPSTSHP